MPTNVVELASYTGPISHPNPGELASASQLLSGVSQNFANRTRYLFIDSVGEKIANSARRQVVVTTDDLYAVVAGDPTGLMAVTVCGENGRIATSLDGDTFTARTAGGGFTGAFNAGIQAPGFNRTILVGANQIQTSDNASTWTARTIGAGPTTPVFNVIDAGGGVIVAAGSKVGGVLVQRSVDNGVTWTDVALPGAPNGVARGLAWNGSRFILAAVIAGQTNIYGSTDGAVWTLSGSSPNLGAGPFFYATLAWSPFGVGRLVLTREGGVVYSDDLGVTWSGLVPLYITNGGGGIPQSLVFARGAYVAYGISGGVTEAWISDNGTEWFRCGAVPPTFAGIARYVRGRWFVPSTDGNVVTSTRSAEF